MSEAHAAYSGTPQDVSLFNDARRLQRVRGKLLRWYRVNARPFPWRRTRNPYRILLSEIMLQQTQASRVAEHYPRFLKRFPTLAALAEAPRSEVLRAWKGMGYNNRAVRLHTLAQQTIEESGGRLPADPAALRALPGIGQYTANAVACFAFGRSTAVVDVNVARVLARLAGAPIRSSDYQALAERLLAPRRAFEWNQAMMELGALICTASRPSCILCPLRRECVSAHRPAVPSAKFVRREPRHHGVPRRIHRGRIVERLRALPGGTSIRYTVLARSVLAAYERADDRWLRPLLIALQDDGVITINGSFPGWNIALAD